MKKSKAKTPPNEAKDSKLYVARLNVGNVTYMEMDTTPAKARKRLEDEMKAKLGAFPDMKDCAVIQTKGAPDEK